MDDGKRLIQSGFSSSPSSIRPRAEPIIHHRQRTDWLSPVEQFSPFAASRFRFLFSRTGAAVVVALFVLGLAVQARGQGAPNVLTSAQVQVFDQLVLQAKKVDPVFLSANAQDAQKRAELSPLGAVNVSAGVSAGTSLTTSGGFDQVSPGVRLSASVDVLKLAGSLTRSNRAQLDALTASTNAAGRELRVRVLQAYTAYLSAVRAAGTAADSLEVAEAALRQAQARAGAGAATGVDVLKAAQAKNSADAALYDANLRLAVAKQQLSAITGLNLGVLDSVLTGVKPKP